MATPKQNFLNQLRAYAQPTPVYAPADIPASVRTYSVFDPSSNTWRRMTNDGRSPIPAQGQAVVPVQTPAQPAVDPVVAALAMAQQTQGRDWSRPLPQTPAQMPPRGSVRPSPASGKQKAVPVQVQAPSKPLNLVRNPAFLATGKDFQSEYDPSLYNGKTNFLAEQINQSVPQVYQGFNYLIPKMPEYEIKTLPAVQESATPNIRLTPAVNKTNWNKVRYTGFPHTLGLVNEPPMTEKERLARENGTYSSLLNLFNYYD